MRVTLKDVAEATGLATSTVSRALRGSREINEGTRVRVRAAAVELGYSLKSGRERVARHANHMLVVLERHEEHLAVPQELVLAGVREFLEERGEELVVAGPALTSDAEEGEALMARAASAVFIMPKGPSAFMEMCRTRNLPIGVANRLRSQLAPLDVEITVHADEGAIARMIADHLWKKGHRRVAFAGHDPRNRMMQTRAEEWRKAQQAGGIKTPSEWVLENAAALPDKLLSLCRADGGPTAVVCASDNVAMQVMHVLRQGGVEIPHDVSVVGVHNQVVAQFMAPPLTSVEIPLKAIGYETARQVFDYPSAPGRAVDVTFQPELVERDSVATRNA